MLSTLAVPALVATVAALVPASADAQDYTSGALVGTVTNSAGAPVANANVTLTSKAQGITRTATTNANGQFTATGMVPGEYTVKVEASGYTSFSSSATIVVSQEVRYNYALTAAGEVAQTVVVKGKRTRQDFTKTTTGLTVDLDTLTKQQPVGRSISAVINLAPTTLRSQQPDFKGTESIGGSSVAENAYYINGLNITNPDTYIGGDEVPFDFYKSVEVKTGGYQAEYGRATGGVVNATTKSGTNDFMFAIHGNLELKSLATEGTDTYASRAKFRTNEDKSYTIEMGGPIIKNHLFAYGLYQSRDITSTDAEILNENYKVAHEKAPFYGLKLDGYITSTQHLELTYFDTKSEEIDHNYDYDDSTQTIGAYNPGGDLHTFTGGENYVAKYTGNVTDWFTISAAYGDSKDYGDALPNGADTYQVLDYRATGVPVNISSQPNLTKFLDDTERKFYRFDGDVRFDAMGHHHVRFGLDHEDLSMIKTERINGVYPIQYRYRKVNGNDALQIVYEALGGNVSGRDSAYYLQDSWDISPNLNLQLGVRDDIFQQDNLSGQQYMDLKDNWAPRLGFSWDPTGDNQFKIHGSYGVYYIPPAMTLGFRGKDTYFAEYFSAPAGGFSIDPTTKLPAAVGAPLPSGTVSGYSELCPSVDLSGAPGGLNNPAGTASCTVFGAGVQEPADKKLAIGTKASQEEEFILGGEWRYNDQWTFGLTGIYRTLDKVSEDTDFNPIVTSYCTNILHASCDDNSTGYIVWNPGNGATITPWDPIPGQPSTITITQDQLKQLGFAFPKAKRQYEALIFDFKRAYDGKWGIQGSYTLSKSWGNYEGTVKSDAGNNGQDGAGATQDFDYIGLTDYSSGLLPNHHAHTFKVWGTYSFNSAFSMGANVLVQSPAHMACQGVAPETAVDDVSASYGAASFYCQQSPAPRGTSFKTDWVKQIDLSLRYSIDTFAPHNLTLRADIFNLFDNQAVIQRYAVGDTAGPSAQYPKGEPDPLYLSARTYQQPRYVRIGFDLAY